MPTFKSPRFVKTHNPKSGSIEPSYIFDIIFQNNDTLLDCICDDETLLSVSTLQNVLNENEIWWNTFLNDFLSSSSKFFSKHYTLQQLLKVTKHNSLNGPSTDSFPVTVTFIPKSFQILSGTFYINWEYITKPVVIDIPVEEESLPSSPKLLPDLNKTTESIEELNIDELPEEKNSTDNSLSLDNPNQFYDKQKVKESRLKAKLAVYRAQYQLNRYYEKYGNELSDSDTETDYELSDDEVDTDNDEKNDFDVQL